MPKLLDFYFQKKYFCMENKRIFGNIHEIGVCLSTFFETIYNLVDECRISYQTMVLYIYQRTYYASTKITAKPRFEPFQKRSADQTLET
jgi:hypothetical protein